MKNVLLLGLICMSYSIVFSQSSSRSTFSFNQYSGLSDSQKKELQNIYHSIGEKNFHCFDLITAEEKKTLSGGNLNQLARQRAKQIKAYYLASQGVKEENIFLKFSGSYPALWLHKPEGILIASGKVKLDDKNQQCYKYNAATSSSIPTASGASINFGPYAFVNQEGDIATGNNISICFWEFTDKKDLVRSNLTTSSGHKIIETAGSYYIEAYQNGEKLSLAPGQYYSISIPTQTQTVYEDMFTYYGSNQNGFVDWEVDKTQRVVLSQSIQQNGEAEPVQVQVYNEDGDIANNVNDGTVFGAPFEYEEEPVNFYEMSAGQLGWINCDRFYDAKNTTTLAIRVDSEESMVVRLVFRDINSVMPAYSNSNYYDRYEAIGIPVGEKVLVLAYSVKGDGALLGYKEVTIGENSIEDIRVSELTSSRLNGAIADLVY